MIKAGKEIIILAPKSALLEAKQLKKEKKYKEALSVLQNNIAQFEISAGVVTAKVSNNMRSRRRRF